jgi:[ribosomal protein S18]-alanine N-acetyltransferase
MAVIIREMRSEDLDSVTEIAQQVTFDTPWSRKIFEDCLTVGYSCWILEEDEKEVLGFGLLSAALEEAHILNLCVKEGRQEQGLGTQMLAHLVSVAKDKTVKQIYLEVSVDNQKAIKLYEKWGFGLVGVRHGYYHAKDGAHDAWVMVLHLS